MARWSIALGCLVLVALAGSFITGPILHGQNDVSLAVAVPKEMTSYRDIVKRVLPAVVSIESQVKPKPKAKSDQPSPKRRSGIEDQIPEEFRKYFEGFGQVPFDLPEEMPHTGFGSGFLVDPKGVILTNFHVVAGADQVKIQLKDGRKFVSKDIHGDRKTDLAIVRINAKTPLPYLDLGDSDAMEVGDRVLAVGAPFGLTGSVTVGIVSAKGRNGQGVNMYEDFLQTDAAINPGNSGGPLINLEGKVIGIDSAIKTRTGGFQGVGLAISSNLAKNVMQALLTGGVVHRGYLGVQIDELNPDVAARLDVKENTGVVVGRVFEGSPAEKAGIQAGDIVTNLGGKPVENRPQLQRVVAGLPLHKPVDVTVLRDGKTRILQVTIEEQPESFGTARVPRPRAQKEDKEALSLDKVGVKVKDLTPEQAEQLGYKETEAGVVITKVEPGSVAGEAGLERGMLITKVDSHLVKSAEAARDRVDKGSLEKGILLQVQSPQGGTTYVVLKAEAVK